MTTPSTSEKKQALLELAERIRSRWNCWLYPTEPKVQGFLGVGAIFIVGDQPSTDRWEVTHPHRRAFYDLLATEGAGDFHLTDIYKRRGLSGELRNSMPEDFDEHLELFRIEVDLLRPRTILAMGRDAHRLLLTHTPELTSLLIRVWHFGTVRHVKLKEFQASLRRGINAARRREQE